MKYQIRWVNLPLAVYREIEAHLHQVDGVEAGLVAQQSNQFDYHLSQVDHLWLQYADAIASDCREQVQQILAYYSDRYGTWEAIDPQLV